MSAILVKNGWGIEMHTEVALVMKDGHIFRVATQNPRKNTNIDHKPHYRPMPFQPDTPGKRAKTSIELFLPLKMEHVGL